MKKLFLSAAAIGLLSGVAVAEPQKLDDQILQDVAAGEIVGMPGLFWAQSSSDVITNTTTNNLVNTTETRTNTSNVTSSNLNNVYSTGVGSSGVTATGSVTSNIMIPMLP